MTIFNEDLSLIFERLVASGIAPEVFSNRNILVTGCAGFLGRFFSGFFAGELQRRRIFPKQVVLTDSFIFGRPRWLDRMAAENDGVTVVHMDISKPDEAGVDISSFEYIIHLASIASPTFYRKFPFETVDANIWGLRRLIDSCDAERLKGLLFFSSSEIYGDPAPEAIPTPEEYPGRVQCRGPRACYDESKRFGETLCHLAWTERNIPVATVRPFNNYGPGMRIDDRRVPADFARAVLAGEDIVLLSDGTPSRTFCYVVDAIYGYILALLKGMGDVFNIGSPGPEITVLQLAEEYVAVAKKNFGYAGRVRAGTSEDSEYLTHNPQRRCPDLTKAKIRLGYEPVVTLHDGIGRYLRHLTEEEKPGV